jgi:alpha-L-rhamnosidase
MPELAAPSALRFEHHPAGRRVLGIGTPAPRLSWQVTTAPDDYRQARYELEITRNGTTETHPTASGEQILVAWPSAPLTPREIASVRVRVGNTATWSAWSAPAEVEAGLLTAEDWSARFISPREIAALQAPSPTADKSSATGESDFRGSPAPIVSGGIELPGPVAKARLYITAHGIYVARINGERVGDEQLAPGWTAYHHRLRYQTHDVTGLLRTGANQLDILLGNGWFRGRLGFRDQRALYGDRLAALAQLEVTLDDGSTHVLGTDGGWTARESRIVDDQIYDGQHTDLTRAEGAATPVDVVDADLSILVAPDGPPVRVTEVLPAKEVSTSPAGKTLVDFGQNLVGWVRLTTNRAGQTVTIRHAEVLEDGELGVRPLRTAKATDVFRIGEGGEGSEGGERITLEPELTFHGFRYAEVTGADNLRAEDIEAVVIHSDLERTGWFESSHELLNRFHDNVVWGMRGNFVDVPTDCPQRDERLGWTGDIQVFSPTASFLFDSAGFLRSWLADLAAEQQKDGSVPYVVPDVIRRPGPATAAWGDAATIVPWVIYQRTGDRDLLERQLPSMRAWVDRMAALAGSNHLWAGGFQFGDWLDPAAPPEDPFRAKADPDVIATAHLARSAEIVSLAAEVAGDPGTARGYGELAARVRDAFAREYVTPGGRVLSDAATTYALALQWALLPDQAQRREAGDRLADLVRGAGFRISTGFVGTPLMTDALTDSGHAGLAYRLLLQTGCPSWLYPVTMGATTVWERWDSMLPDGSINPGEMTSFNHYALGAVADWLHRRVAGLAPGAPGYQLIEVRPLPSRELTRAKARHRTPYGEASVAWQRAGGELTVELVVPVGATAVVTLPGSGRREVRHGRHEWTLPDPYAQAEQAPTEPDIRQLMDHAPSWDRLVSAAVASGVAADEAALADRLTPYFDAPATTVVDAATADGFIPGADRMRALYSPAGPTT